MTDKKKKKLIFHLATKLGWLLILLLGRLTRIKAIGFHHVKKVFAENASLLYALWHGRILVPIYLHRTEGITAMVSQHADGEMIAQTLHKLGYQTVRGSSTRGGNQAFHEMVALLNRGVVCAILPDGPRGPRHYLKPGTLYIAQQAQAYLLPVTFSSNRKIVFNSWDRFTIPMPFSRSIIIYGEPIKVAAELSPAQMEELRLRFEKTMMDLELQADEHFRK